MSRNISVFVLILNYNSLTFNKACIDSILKQDVQNVKILFLDNGSGDGSLEAYEMYFEDVELSFRFILAGYDLHVVPGTRVRHVVAGSSSKVSAQRIYFCERILAPAAVLLNLFRKRPDCSLSVFKAMGEGGKQLTSQLLHTDPAKEALLAPVIDTKTVFPPIWKSK